MRSERFSARQSSDVGLQQYLVSVYRYMFMGLGVTSVAAILPMFMPVSVQYMLMKLSWILGFGALAIGFSFSSRIYTNMSIPKAQALFWVYSALIGLSLTGIFVFYRAETIAKVFLITAAMFGGTSVYGYMTQRDLSSIGSFCFMGVLGLIVASLVNFFIQSSAMDFALSCIGVAVFTGLTAYDTQFIKYAYYQLPYSEDIKEKSAILGALRLYLDFVNMFLSLLRLLGDRK